MFNQWPYTNLHELNLDWILKEMKDLDSRVSNLVVSEGSFVTPEQYGAVGDGVTDDTAAVNAAINSGKPVIMDGKYKITGVTITEDDFFIIAASPLTCDNIDIRGNNGRFHFGTLTTNTLKIQGANNQIGGVLLLNNGTAYTTGLNILGNNTRVDIGAINNFYIGIGLGYSKISANSCIINFNNMYGCTIGIQINAGVRNLFTFGSMSNDGTGNGIYVAPVETAAGENRFIFGSISAYNTGVLYNTSDWNAEGYVFIGSIFTCKVGFQIGAGVHGYVTYIGTVDNIDVSGGIDVDDKSYKNNWIMPYVRYTSSDFAATSRVVEMETGTQKLPIVPQPSSGIKGEIIFTEAGSIVYHDGSGFKTVSSS